MPDRAIAARSARRSTSDAAGDLTAVELADAFGKAAKQLGRRFNERLERHGESMPRFRLLLVLADHGPLRPTELAARVGVSQGTASTLAEALVRDGLVERDADPADNRATRLSVTAEGGRRAEQWYRDYRTAATEIFGVLPKAQWPVLMEILDSLTAGAHQPLPE